MRLEKFLPYIDNWATCDLPLPKCFDKNKEDILVRAKKWIASRRPHMLKDTEWAL